MRAELIGEVQRIRNEIANSKLVATPTVVVEHLRESGIQIALEDLPELFPTLSSIFGRHSGTYYVPSSLLQVIAALVEGNKADTICDPCAGIGSVLATLKEATHASRALAFTQRAEDAEVGKYFLPSAEWQTGDPFDLLGTLRSDVDIFATVLPFSVKTRRAASVRSPAGDVVQLSSDLGQAILVAAALRLSANGVGLFVTTPSFFFSKESIRSRLNELGLSIHAAFLLPPGAFAPVTSIPTYLLVVRRSAAERMFVAQLSTDATTNREIVTNFKNTREGGSLELGRFVNSLAFTGLQAIKTAERFSEAERQFGAPAVRLGDMASTITLGRPGDDFDFPQGVNTVFIPLVGSSDVVESAEELHLKKQNYAQIDIDPFRSEARFVARFLNSELGKEIRETGKTGIYIPKHNKQTLKDLRIFVPPLERQRKMIEAETRIAVEMNTVLGIQNELSELRRELWTNRQSPEGVNDAVELVSRRISGGLKEHVSERLDQWFETLPFPLASILRAWQATSSQDYKTKHEHLLHFFEATAEFVSMIFLSAFDSREALFEPHKVKLKEALAKQNLSFRKATFGTWKAVVEYLGKQTRQLLISQEGGDDNRAVCAEMFADPSLALPTALSRTELAGILSRTNKMRNDWTGHGGVVGLEEAQLRNEQLLAEVQNLREVLADTWAGVQLIRALNCRPRRGLFENEIAILMGSNSDFLKETRHMSMWLDVEELYLTASGSGRALRLMPFVKVGPSPQSAKNACYFFNRLDNGTVRFVSYHFTDKPEIQEQLQQAPPALQDLVGV
jgi:hypothetical protein